LKEGRADQIASDRVGNAFQGGVVLLLGESFECGQAKRLFVLYQPVYNQLVG
jgi:hypothetical protein